MRLVCIVSAFFCILRRLTGGEPTHVAPRTARAHPKALVDLGILGQAEVFPAHRYRMSEHAMTRNKMYMIRLKKAA